MFAPGNLVGSRYRLLRLIGHGGMGAVWAAKNEAISRDVAIKFMRPDVIARDPTALARFFNEARICGSIRHPGIVDVLDLGRAEDGSPFLVMELLNGRSLDALLARGRLLPLEILPIVRDVARTIALAHAQGVVHRDLKPANLFLHATPTGEIVVKVLDFGISKVTERGRLPKIESDAVVGSPAYMSPEQAEGRAEVDARSDVYSLGVILFQAMSGRFPFDISNYEHLVMDLGSRDPPSLAAFVSDIPPPVADVVKFALEREVKNRVGSANELADRLEAVIASLGGDVRTASAQALPRVAAAAFAAAATAAAQDAVLAAWEGPKPQTPASGTVVQTGPAMSTTVIGARRRSPAMLAAVFGLGLAVAGMAITWWVTSHGGAPEASASAAAAAPGPSSPSPAVAAPSPAPTATAEASAEPRPEASAEPSAEPVASATKAPKAGAPRAVRPSSPRPAALPPTTAPPKKKEKRTWGYD